MSEQELQEARKSFDSWAALTVEMIDDGILPGGHERQEKLRGILTDPAARDMAFGIFLAGLMSVEIEE